MIDKIRLNNLGGISSAKVLMLLSLTIGACSDKSTGNVTLNQSEGVTINAPEFLNTRAIIRDNMNALVTVTVGGRNYEITQTSTESSPWRGEVFVPEGSDPTLTITWLESQVPDLPVERNGELPLAIYTTTLQNISLNASIQIDPSQYITQSTSELLLPELDIDNDGSSNFEERLAGSKPADSTDVAQLVSIPYVMESPIIDGQRDPLWENAQQFDRNREVLKIDNIQFVFGRPISEFDFQNFRWEGMHDGEYLYLLIFGEEGNLQTPFGDGPDSAITPDDSIAIHLDGNHSRGRQFDGIDDYEFLIALLTTSGAANSSNSEGARFGSFELQLEDDSAVEYATCICSGDEQLYEVKLRLADINVPIDRTLGFDVRINNDHDGGLHERTFSWHDNSGSNSTPKMPNQWGSIRLESLPK